MTLLSKLWKTTSGVFWSKPHVNKIFFTTFRIYCTVPYTVALYHCIPPPTMQSLTHCMYSKLLWVWKIWNNCINYEEVQPDYTVLISWGISSWLESMSKSPVHVRVQWGKNNWMKGIIVSKFLRYNFTLKSMDYTESTE